MQITRTTNSNGTYRYTLSTGRVITKGSKRRSEWGTIYRLTAGFGTNNTGDITATTHARQDLAAKGSRDLTGAGWVIIAVVEIIDGDETTATEEEQSQTSDQATTDTTPASSRIASAQAEGNETATLALIDRPEDMHAIDAAWDAGARWARAEGGCYRLAMPGELETLAIVDPSDLTADLGSNLNRFR